MLSQIVEQDRVAKKSREKRGFLTTEGNLNLRAAITVITPCVHF